MCTHISGVAVEFCSAGHHCLRGSSESSWTTPLRRSTWKRDWPGQGSTRGGKRSSFALALKLPFKEQETFKLPPKTNTTETGIAQSSSTVTVQPQRVHKELLKPKLSQRYLRAYDLTRTYARERVTFEDETEPSLASRTATMFSTE